MKLFCKKYSAVFLFLLVAPLAFTQITYRTVRDFNKDWKFLLGNDSMAIDVNYDDSKWRTLNLPHDWSIEGDFSKSHPATNQGGALPTGIGWYRKTFTIPVFEKNRNVRIEFDGVYRNSEVWINGYYLGKRPNGYISFHYDLSPFIKQAPEKNSIVVKVDNSQQPNSRWYTGSGIYRNVRLIYTNPLVSLVHWGTFITSSVRDNKNATVHIDTKLAVDVSQSLSAIDITTNIYNSKGKLVRASRKKLSPQANTDSFRYKESLMISNADLWSPANPVPYRVEIIVRHLNTIVDRYTTPFGIRNFNFDAQEGFLLNGKPLKILGVCMHHDLGALGAAFNVVAARRQLRILKEMGCNAIRTAHNPPAPEFLSLCDEMGFLVMDEAFDMWQKRKNRYDYHLDFKEWYARDLEAMVLRDRNHPSVFMWSIGNEIREQFDSTGIELTKKLTAVVKNVDSTRPVSNALTENIPAKNFIYQSGVLDVLGFNYKLYDYNDLPSRFPGKKIVATETASALATRGVYDLPSDTMRIWPPDSKQPFLKGNPDMTVSAYDHAYAYWGATHEKAWLAVKKQDFIAGCFVWSGFDFLGEPVPYPWPARSSYYGIVDLAGFPKDVYYMYQSEWSDKPVLHLFPHWNWQPGTIVDVWAYYNNADEVELFLNGKSLGAQRKMNDELHVRWKVPFQPGTLKAVSRKNGKIVLTKEIKTAGKPATIKLKADKQWIWEDGSDLVFVTVTILDDKGIVVPDADDLIEFSITGAGMIAGTDNGYQADTVSLKSNKRKCWKGMALAIIQSTGKKGNITLKATAPGIRTGFITLKTSR